jgi:hypothetical protein
VIGPAHDVPANRVPPFLVHGTYEKNMPGIRAHGLIASSRAAYLLDPLANLGTWRGDLEVEVTVDTALAQHYGAVFQQTGNRIWLSWFDISAEAIVGESAWNDVKPPGGVTLYTVLAETEGEPTASSAAAAPQEGASAPTGPAAVPSAENRLGTEWVERAIQSGRLPDLDSVRLEAAANDQRLRDPEHQAAEAREAAERARIQEHLNEGLAKQAEYNAQLPRGCVPVDRRTAEECQRAAAAEAKRKRDSNRGGSSYGTKNRLGGRNALPAAPTEADERGQAYPFTSHNKTLPAPSRTPRPHHG